MSTPPASAPASAHRKTALDVLRAVAVLLVLGNHMPAPSDHLPGLIKWPLEFWKRGGWIGVDLFFVLSGFLVSGLVFREYRKHGGLRPGRFLLRRALKIYPPFYTFFAISLVGWALIDGDQAYGRTPDLGNIFCELLFIQNYWVGGVWGHTWSLAVEEHFYLGLSLLLWLLIRRSGPGAPDPFRALPRIFVVVAVMLLALRIHNHAMYTFRAGTHMFRTHLRFDSLLFGAVLGYAFHFHHLRLAHAQRRFRWVAVPAAAVAVLVSMFVPLDAAYSTTLGFVALFLANGVLVLTAAFAHLPQTRLVRAAAYVGLNSYSVYLWHYPVHQWLEPALVDAGWQLSNELITLIYFVLSLLLGIGATRLIERPVLRARNRYFPSRSGNALLPNPNRHDSEVPQPGEDYGGGTGASRYSKVEARAVPTSDLSR